MSSNKSPIKDNVNMVSVGIDGCKSGWMAVNISDGGFGAGIYKSIGELCSEFENSTSFLIDMPIGLPEDMKDIRPDAEARKVLSGRTSCIFNTPCRQAIYSDTYINSSLVNKNVLNKGLSQQSFAITSKIREIDEFLIQNPYFKNRLKESHPEICLAIMNSGKPIKESKHTPEGLQVRIDLLARYYDKTYEFIRYINQIPEFKRIIEDCIDALCLAITGMLGLKHGFRSIPDIPMEDSKGLLMQIVYANIEDQTRKVINKNTPKKIQYDKLIRDKIPEVIEKSGKKAFVDILDDKSYKKYLDIKLEEELQEYLSGDNPDELADLVEVIYAILKYKGITIEEFESIRRKKAQERGAFDKRLLLKEVIEE